MQRRLFLCFSTLVAGCTSGCGGGGGGAASSQPAAALTVSTRLHRRGVLAANEHETALVVFGGEVLAITFMREWSTYNNTGVRIRRFSTGEVIAEKSWPGMMGSAIVEDGVIHIYGNSAWDQLGNKLLHSTLAADFTPSAATEVLSNNPARPFAFYNTSICKDASGFKMVVETSQGVFFADSADLVNWAWSDGQLYRGKYVGCPSIHYLDGAHHLTMLVDLGEGARPRWVTNVAKSLDDCVTFTYGKTLLSPGSGEGVNASDVDVIEFGGKVYGVFMDGDQKTYAHVRTFIYDGSMAQMFAEFA